MCLPLRKQIKKEEMNNLAGRIDRFVFLYVRTGKKGKEKEKKRQLQVVSCQAAMQMDNVPSIRSIFLMLRMPKDVAIHSFGYAIVRILRKN